MGKIIKSQDGEVVEFPNGVDLGPNKVKWARKILTSGITNNTPDPVAAAAGLTFSNLVVGRVYKYTFSFYGFLTGNGDAIQQIFVVCKNGTTTILELQNRNDTGTGGDQDAEMFDKSVIFVATDTTVTVEPSFSGAGTLGANRTWATLEYDPNYETTQTTDWD